MYTDNQCAISETAAHRAGGVHQIAGLPVLRQRLGGRQERSHHPQAHRIRTEHASRIQEFYIRYLNPYLNYHRPCGFATVTVEANGKRRRRYPLTDYATPYEKLKSLRESGAGLRPGLDWEALERIAKSASDTEFAERMRRAKMELLRQCKMESPLPPSWG